MPDLMEGESSFEDTLAQIRSLSEANSQELSQTPAEEVPVAQEAATEAQTPTEGAPQASEQPVPAQAPIAPENFKLDRIQKFLAKEAALLERERKLEEREKQAPSAKPQPAQSQEQMRAQFRANPLAFLRTLDPEFKPGPLAKTLWHYDLGDLAPPEAKAHLEGLEARGTVEQLRHEMEEYKQQVLQEIDARQQQAAYQQYMGAIQQAASNVPDEFPLAKKFASTKPEKVTQALVGIARQHAQKTGGEVLTPQQTIQRLEARLKDIAGALGVTNTTPPAPTPTQAAPSAQVPKTIQNKHTAVQPSRVVDDDLDDDKLRAKAMAAIEALKRQEAAAP